MRGFNILIILNDQGVGQTVYIRVFSDTMLDESFRSQGLSNDYCQIV